MLRILYYLCKKSGKISTERGVSLYYVMGVYYVYYGKLKMFPKHFKVIRNDRKSKETNGVAGESD